MNIKDGKFVPILKHNGKNILRYNQDKLKIIYGNKPERMKKSPNWWSKNFICMRYNQDKLKIVEDRGVVKNSSWTTNYIDYQECQKFVQITGIKNQEDWMNFVKTFKDEMPKCIPRDPSQFYRRNGHTPIWIDFIEAKKIIMRYNYKSRLEYTTNYEKENFKNLGIPVCPERVYGEQWKGWKDYLGTYFFYKMNGKIRGKKVPRLSFKKLKKLVRQVGLTKYDEFLEWRITCGIDGIYRNPDKEYKEEWKGFHDFFGKVKTPHIFYKKKWGKSALTQVEWRKFYNKKMLEKSLVHRDAVFFVRHGKQNHKTRERRKR